jgi:hypothetical protein
MWMISGTIGTNAGDAILTVSKEPQIAERVGKSLHTFGNRFEYFCGERLGLKADHPVVRQ